ncbi:hypothetical protein ACMT4L_16995 [Deinococcus sp. A31D244]|uniref:hypothetical protein n=1 Tax=Deinococcus sp. A31D244 TaxID=3397675 RepID=UPI0039DFDBAD
MTDVAPDAATVQDLATLIRPLADRTSPHARTSADYLTDGAHDELPEYIQQVISMCEEVLITSAGKPAYDAHRELQALTACHVGPGERDSFGWLTAVLHTPGGMVVFG